VPAVLEPLELVVVVVPVVEVVFTVDTVVVLFTVDTVVVCYKMRTITEDRIRSLTAPPEPPVHTAGPG
jgi:hypothetical protein